jgi:hypothetical protein
VTDPTCTGEVRWLVVPSPPSPSPFHPQHHSVPSVRVAQTWSHPPPSVAQVVAEPTCTGVERFVVAPSPTLP